MINFPKHNFTITNIPDKQSFHNILVDKLKKTEASFTNILKNLTSFPAYVNVNYVFGKHHLDGFCYMDYLSKDDLNDYILIV